MTFRRQAPCRRTAAAPANRHERRAPLDPVAVMAALAAILASNSRRSRNRSAYAGNPKDHTFHFDTTRKASQACADPTVLPQLAIDLEVDRANQRTDVDEDMLKLLNKGHCQPLIPALDHDRWSFVRSGVVTRFGKPTTVVLMQYGAGQSRSGPSI